MADEIAQVLAMEVDGVKLVFKASLEVAEFLARAFYDIFIVYRQALYVN